MITHDVDEAIYLADKIVLMTNGPGAVIAEIVENPLPKDRERIEIHHHPHYYARAQSPDRFPGQPQQDLHDDDRQPRPATRAGRAARAAASRAIINEPAA